MNLRAKKQLASKTFGVGKKRIVFVTERLDEIKEAITKQDMRDLKKDGAIIIKEIGGRSKNLPKNRRKGVGKIRRKVDKRKKEYVILTRKLRKFLAEKKKRGEISKKEVKEVRKKIRNKLYKSKAHLKDEIGGIKNENIKKKKKRK